MKHHTIKTIILALLLAASIAACKKKAASGGGGIGVPECDDYFARMEACAKKTGSPAGDQLTKMAAMMRKAWGEDVADAEKKKAMPGVCTSAIKDMQKQLPDCDWGIAPAPTEGSAGSGSAAPTEGSAGSAAAPPTEGSAGSGSAAPPAGSGSAKP
jgi:hypothetical protein